MVPIIVLAEVTYIFEKGRTDVSLREVLLELDKGENYTIVDFDRTQLELLADHDEILEMHDRIIVSVADVYDAQIITKDKEIHDYGYVRTIWD